jgi:rRNA maturation protein Nop10
VTDQAPTASNKTLALTALCRNCGSGALGKYCPACGQETTLHRPNVFGFIHEFFDHYVSLEGKIWRTFGRLLFSPGYLTKEYFAGRRRRYVLPLRLYLTCSIVFFLLIKVLLSVNSLANPIDVNKIDRPALVMGDTSDCPFPDKFCKDLFEQYHKLYANMSNPEMAKEMLKRSIGAVPYAMFFLLPIFTCLLALIYFNRRMFLGEHLVFSLHVHAFLFLLFIMMALLPDGHEGWLLFLVPPYMLFALKQVYQGRWFPTILRGAVMLLTYSLTLFSVIITSSLLAITY